jgi:hypothetical protein
MENKSQIEILNEKIYSLQNQQIEELKLLKDQFHYVYESVKPINMLKNAFKEMTSSPEIKGNLVDNAIGLTTGFLSKKLIFGGSINPIRNILGNVLQYAVSNIVSKHTDSIKSNGANLLLRLFNRKKNKRPELSNHEA